MMIVFIFWVSLLMILYTYFGYPLLLGVLTLFSARSKTYSIFTPVVTLLIAAYNERTAIAKKIENSLTQDYPREKLQILIAADGSDDGTDEIVRSYSSQGVELSYIPERGGKMAAINRALPNARGEIIVMSDANNQYSLNVIKDMVAPFSVSKVGATSGAKAILKGDALSEAEGAYWKYESWIKNQENRLGCCTAAAGEIFAFRKSLFVKPPDSIINDDFYIMMGIIKQDKQVVYVPQALSLEHVSLTAQDEVTRRTRIIAGRYQAISRAFEILPFHRPVIVWQIVSHKFLRPLVPFAMFGVLLASFFSVFEELQCNINNIICLSTPYNWVFLILQLSFYLFALFGEKIKSLPFGQYLYLPAFLVNSNMAAVRGLFRYLFGGQTTRWQRVERREEPYE